MDSEVFVIEVDTTKNVNQPHLLKAFANWSEANAYCQMVAVMQEDLNPRVVKVPLVVNSRSASLTRRNFLRVFCGGGLWMY